MSATAAPARVDGGVEPMDTLGRPLRDLRISVTDRCNFRCSYCMPRSHFGPGYRFVPQHGVLTTDEVVRLAGIFVSLGVTKVRLTGGEPLLRAELDHIVSGLASLDIADIALTTNGALLRRWAGRLRDAGLRRVTVSLDTLDPAVFSAMSDSGVAVTDVLDGIAAAREHGLTPIKVNCVVKRDVNEAGLMDLVEFARREQLLLRFIEFMDVGNHNRWRREDVVTGDEIIERVSRTYPLQEIPSDPSAVARTFRFADGGLLGVVASVSRPFCGGCTRARLGVDGHLFTCLFSDHGLDLRGPLRAGADDDALRRLIASRWSLRDDRYSELRAVLAAPVPHVEMSYIGG